MSPEPVPAPNRTVVYLLGAIVVLLVALVAIFMVTSANKTPNKTATTPPPSASTQPTATSMPGIKPSTGAAFDPATATKVPSGTTPVAYVKLYYQSILDKKWDVAFKMQPAASQQGGTVQDFQSTQTGYGMTAFKIITSATQGDTATVEVEQDLGTNGKWGALWTLVKYKGEWVVKSRQVQMK